MSSIKKKEKTFHQINFRAEWSQIIREGVRDVHAYTNLYDP